MKSAAAIFSLVFFLLATLVSTSASAHRYYRNSGVRLGVFVGPGFFYGPSYYPYYSHYPYYSYPRVVVTPPSAPVYYIEKATEQVAPALAPGYWYYCNDAKGYYPYVKECPGGWQPVAPQPPN